VYNRRLDIAIVQQRSKIYYDLEAWFLVSTLRLAGLREVPGVEASESGSEGGGMLS